MPGTPGARVNVSQQTQRAKAQQAVLDKLRGGGVISGAQPANPIIGGIQSLFGGAGRGAIPPLGAATLGGQEVLMNRGGWDPRRAGSGPINVGGQTWYPAQSGQDLVYKRAPGQVGGQYGSIVSRDQFAPLASADPTTPPPPNSPAAERAYQQEASRVAQLTAQDPELKRYEDARTVAAAQGATPEQVQKAEDIGMQIWAARHGGLAKQVKPGQSGYEAIQRQLGAGQMGAPMELGAFSGAQPTDLLFNPSNPLGAAPPSGPTDYTQVVPAAIGGTLGLGGGYFNNPQQAQLFSRFQQAAPAQSGMNPGLAPGSPFAQAAAVPGGASYAGATGIQPVGSSITQGTDSFASDKAQQQAEDFKKRLMSVQQ